jgi:TRAP-type C4-dicarboxylate transport system permease small subunit
VEKAYALWRAFQDAILARAAALLLLGCTLLALVEVFRRYLLGHSFEWQQDAVTFVTLCGVFLYFALSQRKDAHLNVMLVPELLAVAGPRGRRAGEVVRLFANVFSFAFLCAVVYWGIPEVEDSIHYESRTESLAFPMWPFLLTLLVGFAFMALTLLFQIYRDVQRLRGVPVLEEPPDEEDSTLDARLD